MFFPQRNEEKLHLSSDKGEKIATFCFTNLRKSTFTSLLDFTVLVTANRHQLVELTVPVTVTGSSQELIFPNIQTLQ